MHATYTYPRYPYARPAELESPAVSRKSVVVVGGGPVGLTMAIDLAQRGVSVMLLDEDDTVSVGSRGLCYAKRTLEILDRLGCGQAVVDKGVTWNVGRTFHDTQEVFSFNLQPEAGYERPGMVNLQQYHLEEILVARAMALPLIDLRWKHKVVGVESESDGVNLTVETPDGSFELRCDWVVAADGARSTIRRSMGLDMEGQVFRDRFLIADVVMKADFPAERWFWFDPPFHRGQSVLLHRQADNVWRIDFQLGWDADPEEERKEERVAARIRAMLGEAHEFDLEWVSVYTFQCRRMGRFRHGRVLFAGDSAHQVSPFGARGANSGIQDADNLGWKLKAVIDRVAPARLLESYSDERVAAADENLLNSTRSTDFITPKSAVSRLFRNAVLGLAQQHRFARALVNSGRLSLPAVLESSALNTPDTSPFGGWMVPGSPMDDAPITVSEGRTWLLRWISKRAGRGFTLLVFGASRPDLTRLSSTLTVELRVLSVLPSVEGALGLGADDVAWDHEGHVAGRYDAHNGTVYLLRPDQHVAARWRSFDPLAVDRALARALSLNAEQEPQWPT